MMRIQRSTRTPVPRGILNSDGRPTNWHLPYTGSPYFNIPVSSFSADPDSTQLASDFWNNGCLSPGNMNCFDREYTYPIYFAEDANDTYTVTATNGNMDGETIPWNANWTIPAGTDGQFILLDLTNATSRNGFQATVDTGQKTLTATRINLINIENTEASLGTAQNIYTSDGVYLANRGCGIAYLAMLVLPEEVDRGVIGHALSVPTLDAKNTFVAPATKSDGDAGGTVVMGTHYYFDVTDSEIETAVGNLPNDLTPGMYRFARILYTALRDYGFYVTDSSGNAHFQFEANESTQTYWEDLGIWPEIESQVDFKGYPRDILDALTTLPRLKALAPLS